jgi:hypothetical protein
MVLPMAWKPAQIEKLPARAVEPPFELPKERLQPRQARISELPKQRDAPPQQERPAAELLERRRQRVLPRAVLRRKQQVALR